MRSPATAPIAQDVRWTTRSSILVLSSLSASLLLGCAGYRFGAQTLYRPDIRTVYVPVFQSESFRRHLGERLTEAVVKEIELNTPYKVVPSPGADSILNGRLLDEAKYAITENVNDEPRDLEIEMVIETVWRGRGGELLAGPSTFRLPSGIDLIGQAAHFVPEGGQSLTTGQQLLISRLANQIVARMEAPW